MTDPSVFIDGDVPISSFPNYWPETNETNVAFHIFVWTYVALSFLLIAPLVIWGRKHERERAGTLARAGFYNQQDEFAVDLHHIHQEQQQQQQFYHSHVSHASQSQHHHQHPAQHPQHHYADQYASHQHHHHHNNPEVRHSQDPHHQQYPSQYEPVQTMNSHNGDGQSSVFRDPRVLLPVYAPGSQFVRPPTGPIRNVFRGIDRVATTHYPDEDPEWQSQLSGSRGGRGTNNSTSSRGPSQTPSRPSNVPSAATTSRLYQRPATKTQVWDVHVRRWKSRRPIGRPEVIYKAYRDEVSSMGGSSANQSERQSLRRARTPVTPSVNNGNHHHTINTANKSHIMSDVASSILTDDLEGPEINQQRVIINYNRRHRRGHSITSSENPSSVYPDVVDDISPNDAADAGDPGRVNHLEQVEPVELTVCCGPGALWRPRTIGIAYDGLVELAEPDLELKRILQIGIPLTFGAISNDLFHLVTIAFIANFISTDSMVAYVIVHLMLGLTNEVVGAVSDAESTLCSHALSMGNWLLAGQYAQIAIILVLVINGPLLYMWSVVMDDLVLWLIGSEEIARLAQEYTNAVLIYQLLLGVSRTLTVLFHLTGNEKFETRFSFCEGVVMLIATTLVASLSEEATLYQVGGIQLIVGSGAFVAKIAYALYMGWLRIFVRGMFQTFAIRNAAAVCTLLFTTLPLVIGAFLEYGEWEILLFFIASLGPAEVATWAVVGIIWKLLETSTEGIGEAAAIRVAYHLGSGNASLARHASHKALLLSTLQSLFITSVLLMSGRNIANLLTPDPTLQALLSDLLTNVALGNVVMNAAMNVWSLLGAQGRYRLATLVILLSRWIITIPMALVCIYVFELDLNATMGAVTTGFATSVFILSYVFFRSDWERLSRIMQELNAMMEMDSDSDESDDDDDFDDDSEFDGSEVSADGVTNDDHLATTEPVTVSRLSSENIAGATAQTREAQFS